MSPDRRRTRRLTRIVATIGPASDSVRVIRDLVRAGMDVARLNMSHADHSWARRVASRVRQAARAAGRPVGLLVDLSGPKVRLGEFDGPLPVAPGAQLSLTARLSQARPARGILPVAYPHLPQETEAGHVLLLADGLVRLRVLRVVGPRVDCEVLEGREIPSRCGLAIPEARVVRSALTPRDRRDLALAVDLGADFVALSFVRRPEDLRDARRVLARLGGDQLLIAKIETRAALAQLDDILAAADAAMVARGDLGVELPPERVPAEQKRIIEACDAAGKPVITATQMLESMRESTRPTRAEAADVANAVLDGSWALMLSAESASGKYPVESVQMLDRIAREAEKLLMHRRRPRPPRGASGVSEAIADAGVLVAYEVGARALVALTRSGATACQIARHLTSAPAFAYTPSPRTLTRMTLFRGITPRRTAMHASIDTAVERVERDLRRRGDLARGELFVLLGGAPREPQGGTNRLVVHLAR